MTASFPYIVFDVSFLTTHPDKKLTGIERVVLETALALRQRTDIDVRFVEYEPRQGRFRDVSSSALTQIVDRITGSTTSTATVMRPSSRHQVDPHTAATYLREARRYLRSIPVAARRILLLLFLTFTRLIRSADIFRFLMRTRCHSHTWTTDTAFCSLGGEFGIDKLRYLKTMKDSRHFLVLSFVHDLLPVSSPQLFHGFSPDYLDIQIACADHLFVNSVFTRKELIRYVAERGLSVPRISIMTIGSSLTTLEPVRPRVLTDAIRAGEYVLFVSTIEARKNHQLLLDVWDMAIEDGIPVPTLIFVGKPGWLTEEVQWRILHTPEFADRVIWLTDVSDVELAWLYSNCAFTLYPSLAEGWGMPVTESLDFGKVSITSNRTSLPEAGEGLTIMLDPRDRVLWRSTILELWNDGRARQERELSIRSQHRSLRPATAATELIDAITALTASRR